MAELCTLSKKKIHKCCLGWLLAILQVFTLLVPVTALEQRDECIRFEIQLPEETGTASSMIAVVTLHIPDGMEVYGFSTALSVPVPYFECTAESIVVGSKFSKDCIGGMLQRITFHYENAYTPLTAGDYTLFTAQFTVREDTPDGRYTFQTMTEEAYVSVFDENGLYTGTRDVRWIDETDTVYAGTGFRMEPAVIELEIGQSITVSGNKALAGAYIQNESIAGYSGGIVTALMPGVTYGVFTADTHETVTVRITVKEPAPPVPSHITSGKYTVSGKTVSRISPGTTAAVFLGGFADSGLLTVYRADGQASMQPWELVGSGCVVKLTVDGAVQDTKTVIVTGDVSGDGKITAADYVNVKFAVLGKQSLGEVYARAADVNGDGKVSAADYVNIKFHVLGKSQILPW